MGSDGDGNGGGVEGAASSFPVANNALRYQITNASKSATMVSMSKYYLRKKLQRVYCLLAVVGKVPL